MPSIRYWIFRMRKYYGFLELLSKVVPYKPIIISESFIMFPWSIKPNKFYGFIT